MVMKKNATCILLVGFAEVFVSAVDHLHIVSSLVNELGHSKLHGF
jgi:hypothetical protein